MRLRGENILIDRRYRGPLHSANGGYAAGRLAAFVDGPAVEVTLRRPPPLERPLAVAEADGRVLLLDGEALVAEARPGSPGVEPRVVTPAEAAAAATRHVRFGGDNFSECFSCGVRPEDGLCIHVGPVAGRDVHAAPWPARGVSPEVVWAAIDCAGAYAVGGPGRGEVVLGRMTAEIRRLPVEAEQCVVVAWPLGEEGRKLHAGTALLAGDGGVLAVARQTWIQPKTG